ncbi:uncharacterized protein PHALS_06576 [Plasmopara halstedii]|uniref:Uncharacterized protein n=1 Tax=Plasmopara halstedii TaxID=4781 RepID=A0A0N7L835_PLAHL|nr:uncharacterized protein PHALS_06576 [Plasmopara halstedii]CEG48771.1 hypothetical protein PHALS_06576 [Plasmopara halstedii]|eukprot:XP_024585140.1 hypothetical protein PHALS_06576 [Plasmopara halstedii]
MRTLEPSTLNFGIYLIATNQSTWTDALMLFDFAEYLRKNIKLVYMVNFLKNNHNSADLAFVAKFEPLLNVKRRVKVDDESKCADANLSVQRCERIVNPTFDSGTTSTSVSSKLLNRIKQ